MLLRLIQSIAGVIYDHNILAFCFLVNGPKHEQTLHVSERKLACSGFEKNEETKSQLLTKVTQRRF